MSSKLKVTPGGYPLLPRAINTVLRPFQGTRKLRFDAEMLMESARKMTGLDDFGGDDFREPLEILLSDLRAQPPTALGRTMMIATFVKALANRLEIQAFHKESDVPPIDAPLVIIGWHRTGTTFLHHLLDALPGFGYVPLYRLIEPTPRRADKLQALLALRFGWMVAPELPKLHPQALDGPEECWALMFTSFRVDGITMHWLLPKYREFVNACNFGPAYEEYARGLAMINTYLQHEFILKDPAHLVALEALVDAMPKARLIWTHRDPVTALASFTSLSLVQHRSMYGTYDPERAARVPADRMLHYIERGLASRDNLPDGQLLDLNYPETMADPLAAVQKICDYFDIEYDDAGRRAVRERLEYMRANRPPKHIYDKDRLTFAPEKLLERLDGIGYDRELWS